MTQCRGDGPLLRSVRWVDISQMFLDWGFGMGARMSESAYERICPCTLLPRHQDRKLITALVLFRQAVVEKGIPVTDVLFFSARDSDGNLVDLVARPVMNEHGDDIMEFVLPIEVAA